MDKTTLAKDSGSESSSRRIVNFIIIAWTMAAGIGCFLVCKNTIIPYFDSQTWINTDAIVEESYLGSEDSDNGMMYSAHIKYKYLFNNQDFHSTKQGFFNYSSSSQTPHLEQINKFPVGKQIKIFVNPKDPEQAVISREVGFGIILSFIPFLFFFVGLVVSVFRFSSEAQSLPIYQKLISAVANPNDTKIPTG